MYMRCTILYNAYTLGTKPTNSNVGTYYASKLYETCTEFVGNL